MRQPKSCDKSLTVLMRLLLLVGSRQVFEVSLQDSLKTSFLARPVISNDPILKAVGSALIGPFSSAYLLLAILSPSRCLS